MKIKLLLFENGAAAFKFVGHPVLTRQSQPLTTAGQTGSCQVPQVGLRSFHRKIGLSVAH